MSIFRRIKQSLTGPSQQASSPPPIPPPILKPSQEDVSQLRLAIKRNFGDDVSKLSPELLNALLGCIIDKQTYNFIASRTGRPSEQDIAAFEQAIGFGLPQDFRSFSMTGFGCLTVEVKESVWPRPKPGAIVPAWYLEHSIYVYGFSSGVPDYMDMRKQFAAFSRSGQRMAPFLKLESLKSEFNGYCFTPTGGVVFCRRNPSDVDPVDLTFTALLTKEIQTLCERSEKIRNEPNPYA